MFFTEVEIYLLIASAIFITTTVVVWILAGNTLFPVALLGILAAYVMIFTDIYEHLNGVTILIACVLSLLACIVEIILLDVNSTFISRNEINVFTLDSISRRAKTTAKELIEAIGLTEGLLDTTVNTAGINKRLRGTFFSELAEELRKHRLSLSIYKGTKNECNVLLERIPTREVRRSK